MNVKLEKRKGWIEMAPTDILHELSIAELKELIESVPNLEIRGLTRQPKVLQIVLKVFCLSHHICGEALQEMQQLERGKRKQER